MARFLSFFLVGLLLLQTFSRELVVLDYQVHKERITELFCVNKDKPALHCNGKCHLAKQLRKASDSESKVPAAGFAKVKYDVVVPVTFYLQTPASITPTALRFARPLPTHYAFTAEHSVFRPPVFQI
ncbi:hypothetical protein J0X19_21745 [Hymenobacter sp. BT186]|uniref:Uncharacterized protein n=1 Tax=Hymenobacter telluris TaxID=2816474 RepID=A0A939EZY9_9BACT|nr:hypothetical protein [Hymenobacter telluris]MBO0360600.1 hypothetical protein [Hymenobacter telluris]MBW3376627.1 hypothetical protein [Hymenobacter norwichensis]